MMVLSLIIGGFCLVIAISNFPRKGESNGSFVGFLLFSIPFLIAAFYFAEGLEKLLVITIIVTIIIVFAIAREKVIKSLEAQERAEKIKREAEEAKKAELEEKGLDEKSLKKRKLELEWYEKEKKKALESGIEKYTNIIQAYITMCEVGEIFLDAKLDGTSKAMNYKAKEQDWAIAGGLASGLAGGMAGLAVASDVQQRNAEERERASEIRAKARRDYSTLADSKSTITKGKRYYEELLRKFNSKRIDNSNIDEKFKKLRFFMTGCSVTEGKNVYFDTRVMLLGEIEIEGKKAILDGSLKIKVFNSKDEYVGCGYCSAGDFDGEDLSKCGFGTDKQYIHAYCKIDDIADENEKYTCKIEPMNLWLIEC